MAAGQVVNSVVTEVTAETEGLRTKLQVAEGYIDQLKQQTATAGTAATQTGQKFSSAARNIASATENMARLGRVTGESAKQVISQASNIAFAFGPTGAIVGAVGIATLAIVQLFRRTSEEAERTKRVLETLREAAAARGAREDPVGVAEDALEEARAEVAAARAALRSRLEAQRGAGIQDPGAQFELQRAPRDRLIAAIKAETEALRQLGAAQAEVAEKAQAAIDKEAQALGALLASGRASNAERERAKQLIDESRAALDALAAAGKTDAATLAERARLQGRLDALTKSEVKTTKDAAAARREQFDLIAKQAAAAERVLDQEFAKRRDANRQIVEADREAARKRAELSGNAVRALDLQIAETVARFRALGATDAEIERIVAPLEAAKKAAEDAAGAADQIKSHVAIKDQVEANLANPFRITEQAVRDTETAVADVAQRIFDFANAILSVVGALGEMDQETQAIARGAVNLGAGIARAFTGDLAGGGLQSIAGIGDIIQGLSGSAERRQQRQDHKENLDALRKIEKHTGDLVGIQISGRQFADIRAGVESFITATGTAGGHREFRNIDQFFEALGLDWEEVNALAQSMGITLNSTKQSYLDFLEALQSADLFAFVDSFAGRMKAFNLEMELFDEAFDEPTEKFRGAVKVLTDPETGAPGLFGMLDGLDISTEAGRTAARATVQELFRLADAGELTAEQLGGLSLEEFLSALGLLDQQLDAAESAVLSLADTVAQAFSDIALDAAIFGRSAEDQITRQLQALGLSGIDIETGRGDFDLTTEAGRAAALQSLRDLAATTADRELKQLIASVVQSIEGLPELPSAVGEAVVDATERAARTGRTSSSALQTLTIHQGDRLITVAESQLLVTRLGFDRVVAAITGVLAPRAPISAPQIPGFGASFASGAVAAPASGLVVNLHIGSIAVPAGTTDPLAFGRDVGQGLIDKINQRLADDVTYRQFLAGSRRIR